MNRHALHLVCALTAMVTLATAAAAQDKVKVGVFPVSSSLPYFVAVERGFFKEQNIEPEMVRLIGGPPNVAAMITNQIDASAVLVTIEGMNANIKKPGVAMYISVNSQNKTYQMEQFVVRKGFPATSLKDLKGARIMSAPGPANVTMAKRRWPRRGPRAGTTTSNQPTWARHATVLQPATLNPGYTPNPMPPPCARWVSPPPSKRASSPITCWATPMPTPSSLAARSPATSSRAGQMWPSVSRRLGAGRSN